MQTQPVFDPADLAAFDRDPSRGYFDGMATLSEPRVITNLRTIRAAARLGVNARRLNVPAWEEAIDTAITALGGQP